MPYLYQNTSGNAEMIPQVGHPEAGAEFVSPFRLESPKFKFIREITEEEAETFHTKEVSPTPSKSVETTPSEAKSEAAEVSREGESK